MCKSCVFYYGAKRRKDERSFPCVLYKGNSNGPAPPIQSLGEGPAVQLPKEYPTSQNPGCMIELLVFHAPLAALPWPHAKHEPDTLGYIQKLVAQYNVFSIYNLLTVLYRGPYLRRITGGAIIRATAGSTIPERIPYGAIAGIGD